MMALESGMKMLLRNNPAFSDSMIAVLKASGPITRKAFEDGDWHAGYIETSVVMALEPDLVRMEDMALDPETLLKLQMEHPDNYQHAEKIVDDECVIARVCQRPDIKVGVMGLPQKASPELGRKIIKEVVESISEKILELDSKANGVYKEVKFIPEPLIF